MKLKTITTEIIEILWRGPFNITDLKKDTYNNTDYKENLFNKSDFPDYGLYQIYGTHPVFGPNSLLYIGKTDSFTGRLNAHNLNWVKYEYDDVKVYLGAIGVPNCETVTWSEYDRIQSIAEKLLVFMCQPPYNGYLKASFDPPKIENHSLAIYNFGKKALLPTELSTYYHSSKIWEGGEWAPVRYED